VLEKLHETPRNTQANTNVTEVTEGWNDLVAFLGDKSGPKWGAPFAKPGLSDGFARVKGMFVAVPQNEHNWTANRRPIPQT
jgi:hypothetical protein